MALRPILKLRFVQMGFNEFNYKVMEISGFPDENILTSYKYNGRPRIYQAEECDETLERRNILVIDWGVPNRKKILKEGELCNLWSNTDMHILKDEITLFVRKYNSIIEERDANVRTVGHDVVMNFNEERD